MNMKLHAIEELKKVQLEYKKILLKVLDSPNFRGQALEALDVFWLKNKKLLLLYLEYIIEPYETFVFTGAVNIDITKKEHFSFVSIGKYHIFDDNVLIYMKTINKAPTVNEELIKNSIINTISLIDNCCGQIFVIPIREIFSNESMDGKKDIALNIFCKLFTIDITKNGQFDKEHYLSLFKNIDDLEKQLMPSFNKSFTLGKQDNVDENLSMRIAKNRVCSTGNDVEDFLFILFCYINQAIEIICSCVAYKTIPFIRDGTVLINVSTVLSSFKESNIITHIDIDKIIRYMKASFLVHKICIIDSNNSIDFSSYKSLLETKNFSENILAKIDKQKINHMKDIEDIIYKEFDNADLSTNFDSSKV